LVVEVVINASRAASASRGAVRAHRPPFRVPAARAQRSLANVLL